MFLSIIIGIYLPVTSTHRKSSVFKNISFLHCDTQKPGYNVVLVFNVPWYSIHSSNVTNLQQFLVKVLLKVCMFFVFAHKN